MEFERFIGHIASGRRVLSSCLHAGLRDNGKRDKGGEEEEHNHISSPGHSDRLLRPGWRVIHLGVAERLNTPLYWMIQRFHMVGEWPLSSCIRVWTCRRKVEHVHETLNPFELYKNDWKCKDNNVKDMKWLLIFESIRHILTAEESEYWTERMTCEMLKITLWYWRSVNI